MKPKLFLILFLSLIILSFLFVKAPIVKASTGQTATFDFSSGSNFVYDSSLITFENGKAELMPNGLAYDIGKTWNAVGVKPSWRTTIDPSGFIYARGREEVNPRRIYVDKLDFSLNKIWEYTDNPGANYVYHDYGRIFYDSHSGHIYTGGGIKDINTGQWYWYVLALDSNGNKLWDDIEIMPSVITATGYSPDELASIQFGANAFGTDGDGNLYASGISGNTVESLSYNAHLRVIKYDSNGNKIWDKSAEQEWTFGTESDDTNVPKRQISGGGAWDMKVDNSGNVYTTGPGVLLPWPGRGEDYVTTKIDANGNMLWARAWSGTGQAMDRSEAIAFDNEGNVYVGGFAVLTSAKPITLMYDSDGNLVWARNAYNTDSTLTSTANGSVLGGTMDYLNNRFIGYGYSASGGLLIWYDNQGERQFLLKDFSFPTGASGGWEINRGGNYIFLTSSEDAGDPAVDGIFRYKYTYPESTQAVVTLSNLNQAVSYKTLNAFSDETEGDGQVKYQISNNGQDWYYYNGTDWVNSDNNVSQSNLAFDVNQHITDFSNKFGSGKFYFRVFMIPGSPIALKSITLVHDQPVVAPTLTELPETGSHGNSSLPNLLYFLLFLYF